MAKKAARKMPMKGKMPSGEKMHKMPDGHMMKDSEMEGMMDKKALAARYPSMAPAKKKKK